MNIGAMIEFDNEVISQTQQEAHTLTQIARKHKTRTHDLYYCLLSTNLKMHLSLYLSSLYLYLMSYLGVKFSLSISLSL